RGELPHSIAVTIEEVLPHEGRQDMVDVHATVYVERQSQKAIVLGTGGSRRRGVGTRARAGIEELLGTRVYLDLHVQVLKAWQRVLYPFVGSGCWPAPRASARRGVCDDGDAGHQDDAVGPEQGGGP